MTHDVSGVGTSPAAGTGMPTTGGTFSTGGGGSSSDGGSSMPSNPSEAKETAKQVAHEAKEQARNLAQEAKTSLNERSTEQRDKAVGGLRSLSDELDRMASGQGGSSNGTSQEVVRQLSEKARQASDFIEQREPGQILDEVREFARRRPGAFLALAAGAGLVVGRITKAAVAEANDSSSDKYSGNGQVTPRMSTGTYGGVTGDTPIGDELAGMSGSAGGLSPQPLAEDVPRFDDPPTRPGKVA